MTRTACITTVLGRLLLALIFVMSGVNKFISPGQNLAYMQAKIPIGDEWGLRVLLFTAAAIEVLAGLSVLVGFYGRWGAVLLVLFMIPTTLFFHNFWALEDPAARQTEMIMFMKNLAILGGLLLIAAGGPGPCSLDERRAARMHQ